MYTYPKPEDRVCNCLYYPWLVYIDSCVICSFYSSDYGYTIRKNRPNSTLLMQGAKVVKFDRLLRFICKKKTPPKARLKKNISWNSDTHFEMFSGRYLTLWNITISDKWLVSKRFYSSIIFYRLYIFFHLLT